MQVSQELLNNVISTCENQQRKDELLVVQDLSQSLVGGSSTFIKTVEKVNSHSLDQFMLKSIGGLFVFYIAGFVAVIHLTSDQNKNDDKCFESSNLIEC